MADHTPLQHCWDPILDHGGQIAWCIPLDPQATPFRMIQVTKEEMMHFHYRCCQCNKTTTRRLKAHKEGGHGPHHQAWEAVEHEGLPVGPCDGVRPPGA